MATDKELIDRLTKALEEHSAFIEKLKDQPSPYGTVAFIGKEKMIVSSPSGIVEVNLLKGIVVGDTVSLVAQTGQVLGKGIVAISGPTAHVKKARCAHSVEIDLQGSTRVIFKNPSLELKAGDTVQIDFTGTVILEKLESAAAQYAKSSTSVSWDDIAGLDEAKATLREIVELPFQEPAIFKFYGYTPPKGVLLSGPAGNGKTMLGKATATALASVGDGSAGFIYIKGPEVLDKYVGESEKKIRAIFDQARDHKNRHGSPAIVFIDEAEALLSRRGSGVSSDMEKTIVPAFLAEMDGLEEASAIVILATNRPDRLDPAVVRDGRIDRKIDVARPNSSTVFKIALLNLRKAPTVGSASELAAVVANSLLDASRILYTVTDKDGAAAEMTMAGLLSGAMVANVVERAKSFALNRDLKAHTKTGITAGDIVAAVDLIQSESGKVSHDDEIRDFARGHGIEASGYTKYSAPVRAAA